MDAMKEEVIDYYKKNYQVLFSKSNTDAPISVEQYFAGFTSNNWLMQHLYIVTNSNPITPGLIHIGWPNAFQG